MNVLISACLLGTGCRYDGKSKTYEHIPALMEKYNLIPVCPEILGGLPTPRPASEIIGDRVVNIEGTDVTENYMRGAAEALRLARLYGCSIAILKERSPSCGNGSIYDGTFTGSLTHGYGIAARTLMDAGIKIYGESQISLLL